MTFTIYSDENNSALGLPKVYVNAIGKGKGRGLTDVTNRKNTIVLKQPEVFPKKKDSTKLLGNESIPQQFHPKTRDQCSAPTTFIPKKLAPGSALTIKSSVRGIDIDRRHRSNPLAVTDYVDEIFDSLWKKEQHSSISNYMTPQRQPQINATMFSILIDWIVALQSDHNESCTNTLYLTVNIIHRYLERTSNVSIEQLQLVGLTAFLVASKYEDVWPPTLEELAVYSEGAYERQDFIGMETHLLKVLNYRVGAPTADKFLRRFLQAAAADKQFVVNAHYILDGSLLNYNLLQFRPSELAAGAVLIAQKATHPHRPPWTFALEYHTKYPLTHLIPVAKSILVEKFANENCEFLEHKYKKASNLLVPLDSVRRSFGA